MWFFQTSKKFFEPICEMPKIFFLNTLDSYYLFFYSVFSLEIYKLILKSIEFKDNEEFRRLIYIYFFVSLFVSLFRFWLYKWWRGLIKWEWVRLYYEKYLTKFIQAEWNSVEKIWTWRFVTVLNKWVNSWLDMLHDLTFTWLYNILFIFYCLFTIFRVSIFWWIATTMLLFFSTFVAMKANVFMKNKRLLRVKVENETNHQAIIALMSKNELMQNNGLKTIIDKITSNSKLFLKYHHPVFFGFMVIDEFPKVMFLLVRIGLYVYLSNLILLNKSSFSELAIFITILSLMELSVNNFLHIFRGILRDISSVELLWSTFENLTPMKWFETWSIYKTITDTIKIKDLTYWYTNKNIFENFSLEINWLQKTAFVWASGWGKTTLMKIIAWYLRPKSWTVEIFWNDLKKTSLKSYFTNIGYLTQEPSVFDWTIKENLQASASQEVTEEYMTKALKEAECDFVFEYEKWINTEIWEKWIRLSWWQRQRLAIAKIFIKNPEIILLDEPTSALDSFSEEKITKAMHRLFKWRTVIIIAHRLQTVKEADNIILIENWKIIERWTHRELVAKKWIYKNMLDLQSGF